MNFTIQQSRSFEGVCVPLHLTSCLFLVLDSQPTATELFQSLPFGSGTVFRSTSHPRRHFLSSALAWRHTSSNCAIHKTFVVPAKWHCHFGHVNRSTYLLTYLTDCTTCSLQHVWFSCLRFHRSDSLEFTARIFVWPSSGSTLRAWTITQMPRGSCQLSLQRSGGDHEDAPASHGWAAIQPDRRSHNLTLPEATDMAQNRSLWRIWSTYGATQPWVACQKRRRRWRRSGYDPMLFCSTVAFCIERIGCFFNVMAISILIYLFAYSLAIFAVIYNPVSQKRTPYSCPQLSQMFWSIFKILSPAASTGNT